MDGQIVTMVEGSVSEKLWQELEQGYAKILELEPPGGIIESFLLQERDDVTLWRLVTVWKDWEQLSAMRKAHSVPPGAKIFKDIGVEPKVKIFTVKNYLNKS